MFEFSTPMPFSFDDIDKLEKINTKVIKSKIKTLYNCLPYNSEEVSGFEQLRVRYYDINTFEDLNKFIQYAFDKNFEFVYLFNSPDFFHMGNEKFQNNLNKLDQLCEKLLKNNITKIRIANVHFLDYITKKFPEFKIYTSTNLEYTSILQYLYILKNYPNITEIIPNRELNKNFSLLKNIKTEFPKISIEIMVNEGCLQGCPYRTAHNFSFPRGTYKYDEKNDGNFYKFFSKSCSNITTQYFWETLCRTNIIYPWEIQEYAKFGINKFKLAGRNMPAFLGGSSYIKFYEAYIRGIEDYDFIKNLPLFIFSNYLLASGKKYPAYKVDEVKQYLPNISYFEKNGYKCLSLCGFQCNYCIKCAEKLNKKFPI